MNKSLVQVSRSGRLGEVIALLKEGVDVDILNGLQVAKMAACLVHVTIAKHVYYIPIVVNEHHHVNAQIL